MSIKNITGKCLYCDSDIPSGYALFCYQYHGQLYRRDKAREAKANPKPSHVHAYTDGVCVRCVNERRREVHKQNRKYIVSGGTIPQASFAGRQG